MFEPRNTMLSVARRLADGLEAGTIALRSESAPAVSRPRFGIPVSIVLGTICGLLIFFALHVQLPGFEQHTPLAEKYGMASFLGQWLNLPTFVLFFVAVAELIRSAFTFRREVTRIESSLPEVAYERLRSLSAGENGVIYLTAALMPVAGVLGTVIGLFSSLRELPILVSSGQISIDAKELAQSISLALTTTFVALVATVAVILVAVLINSFQSSKLLETADRFLGNTKGMLTK